MAVHCDRLNFGFLCQLANGGPRRNKDIPEMAVDRCGDDVMFGVQTQKFFPLSFCTMDGDYISRSSKNMGHPPIEDCEMNPEAFSGAQGYA